MRLTPDKRILPLRAARKVHVAGRKGAFEHCLEPRWQVLVHTT
jgi:hypothetical protein